jgi:hypothetical protein
MYGGVKPNVNGGWVGGERGRDASGTRDHFVDLEPDPEAEIDEMHA